MRVFSIFKHLGYLIFLFHVVPISRQPQRQLAVAEINESHEGASINFGFNENQEDASINFSKLK